MGFQRLSDTLPFDIDSGIGAERARRIGAAILAHIVPLLVRRHGRWEPLASAGLFRAHGRPVLVTCRHLFETGVGLGDLGWVAEGGTLASLHDAGCRVLDHPDDDVAVIELGRRAGAPARRREPGLRLELDERGPPAEVYAVAGYPYAQMRRVGGRLWARPAVFFARSLPARGELRLAYGRSALRVDGVAIHAPPLDGMSGAPIWGVSGLEAGRGVLVAPVGVQHAFRHDAYVRGAPMAVARELLLPLGR